MTGEREWEGYGRLVQGDCLQVLCELPDASVDTCITDPPYGLSEHKPGEVVACLQAWLAGERYAPKGQGFMGKKWDAWCPGPEVWREVLRVLKPGGTLLCFAGTRSFDLMGIALRLAGFDLWDTIATFGTGEAQPSLLEWVHGQGFPKASDLGKLFDKRAGAEREVVVVDTDKLRPNKQNFAKRTDRQPESGAAAGWKDNGASVTLPATDLARIWDGWKSHGLKPAHEPILCARKPNAGSYCDNAEVHGVAGLWVEGARVPSAGPHGTRGRTKFDGFGARSSEFLGSMDTAKSPENPSGRYPSNVILTCACEGDEHAPGCPVAVMDGQSGDITSSRRTTRNHQGGEFGWRAGNGDGYDGTGGASRFFYCAKASRREREAGCEELEAKPMHPTVKPLALLQYLCRLTATPTGGTVLDPFAGSGTTCVAAVAEHRRFVGVEIDEGYCDIAAARIDAAIRARQPALALETVAG